MNPQRKIDRRIARTTKLLREALMALVVEKGYDSITIQDITDRADVSRTTFYLHFKDKDDLLITSMQALYDTLSDAYEQVDLADLLTGASRVRHDATDFEHVREFATFYRAILGSNGSAAFMVNLQKYLAERLYLDLFERFKQPDQPPRVPLDMLAYYLAGAQMGVIQWWLDHDMQPPPREIAAMLFDTGIYGAAWAAGLSTA